MPDRIIPLESHESHDGDDGPATFLEYIAAIVVDSVDQLDMDGEVGYDTASLDVAITGAFALGCAVGIEFPDRIELILDQAFPGKVAEVLDETRQPIENHVAALRASGEPLSAESFTAEWSESIADEDAVPLEAAVALVHHTFVYGLLLARLERAAAIVLRNAMDRAQREAYDEQETASDDEPFETLQGVARYLMSEYETAVGFPSGA